jgi:hypothetical protein
MSKTEARRALFVSSLIAAQQAQAKAGKEMEQWVRALDNLDKEDAGAKLHWTGRGYELR